MITFLPYRYKSLILIPLALHHIPIPFQQSCVFHTSAYDTHIHKQNPIILESCLRIPRARVHIIESHTHGFHQNIAQSLFSNLLFPDDSLETIIINTNISNVGLTQQLPHSVSRHLTFTVPTQNMGVQSKNIRVRTSA